MSQHVPTILIFRCVYPEYKHEAISWISVEEAISWIYIVGEIVSPYSLTAKRERISIPHSGVSLHSVAHHILSKQHPTPSNCCHRAVVCKCDL